jgi:hypothetical protein
MGVDECVVERVIEGRGYADKIATLSADIEPLALVEAPPEEVPCPPTLVKASPKEALIAPTYAST